MAQEPVNRTAADLTASGDLPELPVMLEPKDKEVWADAGTVFTIVEIQLGSDDTGPYFSHTVVTGGQRYSFRLQADSTRGAYTNALMKLLADGPIDGFILKKLSEQRGNAYLVLAPASS